MLSIVGICVWTLVNGTVSLNNLSCICTCLLSTPNLIYASELYGYSKTDFDGKQNYNNCFNCSFNSCKPIVCNPT